MSKHDHEASEERIKALEKMDVMRKEIEDALRKCEEKYRTLAENIAVGIFRSTPGPSGTFVEVNPAFVKMLGYANSDELLAKDVAHVYQNPEDRLRLGERISATGFVNHEESTFQTKAGTAIIVSLTARAVKDKEGDILYYDCIVEDITERKRAEEERHVQKTYFERLFNSAPEAIALHDNDDRVVDVNEEFTRLFGYTREEAIGKPINDLVAPRELLEEAVRVSATVMRGERVELDTKRKRKDGTVIDVSILGAPIIHNGKQVGDYAIYRDISYRKKAENELRLQKTYLERLFNSAPAAIVWHDNSDLVVNVNDEFTRMFGYSREEAIGKAVNALVAPDECKEEASLLSQRVTHGERVEADSHRRRKDGTLIDVTILGSPIIDGGKQMGVFAIYRDITDRKRAEEARIRLREEARMARDIQTTLLPDADPVIPGYDIAGKSVPAFNVGGDYYDFIRLDEYRLAIGLGDVSGKGLAAALVMANLQATVRSLTLFDLDPKECLEKANKLLYRSTDSHTFVSLFYGVLDTKHNLLCYANAGQDLPIMFSGGSRPRPLVTRGVALGVREDVSYEEEKIPINHGDRLLIYSDGIREAMNDQMEEFGEERLLEVVQRNSDDSATGLIATITGEVNGHVGAAAQRDDMTLVLVVRKSI